MGCDHVPNSGKIFDACAACVSRSDPDFIAEKSHCPILPVDNNGSTGLSIGAIVGICIGCGLLVGGSVLLFMCRRERQIRHKMTRLEDSYVPMGVRITPSTGEPQQLLPTTS